MPVQAIPLALIASVYPFGLAVLLLLLGATRPRARAVAFLAGAAVCVLAVGFVAAFALRGIQLGSPGNSTPRYVVRLAIGVLFLIAALVVARWPTKERQHDEPSRVSKAVAGTGLLAVFLTGIALYTPSPTYLAALDIVGSTDMSVVATVAWVLIVGSLVLITIEVPIVLYVVAPGWTVPKLDALEGWLRRNGRMLLVWVFLVLGIWQTIDGLVGVL
jgi:hypothetical protein